MGDSHWLSRGCAARGLKTSSPSLEILKWISSGDKHSAVLLMTLRRVGQKTEVMMETKRLIGIIKGNLGEVISETIAGKDENPGKTHET